ncbi:MAG: Cys-tRNA(Pro) deacylase [Trueperella sp.]|nr:Cys-tRNA(Pro) deacylase [Trueperella sp.]
MAKKRKSGITRKHSGGTRAIAALNQAGVPFEVIEYEHSDTMAHGYALDTAAVLDLDPQIIFKTLMAEVDGAAVVALVPASARLNLKALAKAGGGKSAVMMAPETAERITGYVTGGISPLGQSRKHPTYIDISAQSLPQMLISGGKRTFSLVVSPDDLARITDAQFVAIANT